MQRIERYGVIALVFLLVTIVAVSLWGEQKKSDGFFSFLKRDSKSSKVDQLLADANGERAIARPEALDRDVLGRGLPLSEREGFESPQAFDGPKAVPDGYNEYSLDARRSIFPEETLPTNFVAEPVSSTVTPPENKPQPAPVVLTASEYKIRAGDTLSQISQRELGTKDRWRELVDANPGLDPARLSVGKVIRLPGASSAAMTPVVAVVESKPEVSTPKPAAKPAAGRSYSVRSGDTLSHIAERELGTQARWRELVELNPGLDPARLLVGQKIRLPEGAAPQSTSVARVEKSAPKSSSSRSKVK